MEEVRCLWQIEAKLGEGAIWDAAEGCLWWVDIEGRMLHRFSPDSGKRASVALPQRIGTVVPRSAGGLAVALQEGVAILQWPSGSFEMIARPEADRPGNRLNDGKCDPQGRLWVGSMEMTARAKAAALYCIHPDRRVEKKIDEVTISNGIVWSSDGATMHYIDTPTREIVSYDFDGASGAISNRRVAVRIPASLGAPDGMAIDCEDKLWVAHWGGWAVRRWCPLSGTLLAEVPVPAAQVTSCAFGGDDLSCLFITTARIGLSEAALADQPMAGSLFACRPGVRGAATFSFAG
jgi:sugar lactone lactonase YvrE